MKYFRSIFFALALILAATPAMAASSSLGIAGNYNGFIFDNFSSTSDTQGRLAVGGNAYLQGYSVGEKIPSGSTGDALVVGGNLTFTQGTVHGDVSVSGTVTGPSEPFYKGTLRSPASINVASYKGYYRGMASSLAGQAVNGTASYDNGRLDMAGDGTGNTQIFNLNGTDLLNSHTFALDTTGFTDNTTLIFNVSGTKAGLTNMGLNVLQPFASHVLFNFYEASTLVLQGIGVWGSILAPDANLGDPLAPWGPLAPQGQLNGTLIANSFAGPMQLNLMEFEGNVPTPIPGSIALLGTGLAGLVAWRRRR